MARKKSFDPTNNKNVKHTRIGVWDLYEDRSASPTTRRWPGWQSYALVVQALPFVWRMIRDIAAIRECWSLLAAYLVVELAASLVPAIALSYSGQLLSIVCHPFVLVLCSSFSRFRQPSTIAPSTPSCSSLSRSGGLCVHWQAASSAMQSSVSRHLCTSASNCTTLCTFFAPWPA